MLNRCFPYQEPLQILSVFHLLLIKSSPRHKRANTLIRQGSRKKNNPCREGTSPPLSCDFLSRRRVGTSGRGGHISAGMRNNLSRWLMINRTRHVGGGTKWYRLPLGWLYPHFRNECSSCRIGIHHSDLFGKAFTYISHGLCRISNAQALP